MFDDDTIETGIREAADQQGTGSQLTSRKVVLAAAATEFISAVVPWPADGVGHINLHYSMVNPRADEAGQEPMLKGMGWPFKDLSTFVQRAAWIDTTTDFKDVWFCTSRQREAALNTKGKPKALRRHANAMDLKAIWIDVDVKPDDTTGKHYTSMPEAWAAISAFRIKVGLPPVQRRGELRWRAAHLLDQRPRARARAVAALRGGAEGAAPERRREVRRRPDHRRRAASARAGDFQS